MRGRAFRRNGPSPEGLDLRKAFHQTPPRATGKFHSDIKIPTHVECCGKAVSVMYRSDKIDPETGKPPVDERGRPMGSANYIHEHDAGVMLYRPARRNHDSEPLPEGILEDNDTLVWLGECLGLEYCDDEGDEWEMEVPFRPDLYCTDDGTCLVVIQDRREILFLVWGGALGVEERGIVG